MSKFNKPKTVQTQKTINLAGGEAYKESDKLELVSLLLTSFAQNSFYEKEEKTNERLLDLIKRNDPLFVAKSAIYARNEFGMRSISHITASELAKYISGETWSKNFYNKIVRRPDDMLEILSYYLNKGNKLANSMKKGFAEAFNKFDSYQLAKYRGEGKNIKLVDLINIVHPVALTDEKFLVNVNRKEYIDILKKKIDFLSKKKKDVYTLKEKLHLAEQKDSENIKIHSHEALVIDLLRSKDTFESELSAAGQKAKTSDEKEVYKKEAWEKLLNERKIGYMALLKNLRNIIEQAPNMVDKACELLTDIKLIKNSLVLPFRFMTAFEEIEKLSSDSKNIRKVMNALNDAIEISMNNVPKFDGDTLLVIDVSGSMKAKAYKFASLFGSVIIKRNDCDVLTFDTTARYVNINSKDSITTITKNLHYNGGGTNFHTIFNTANKAYSRIIILSDMQGWVGYDTPTVDFNNYCKKYNCRPHIFSFDLAGNGTLQFPENKVYALAGFSDKVFDIMKLLESDRQALIHTIESVEL
jgi:hypothetical protein